MEHVQEESYEKAFIEEVERYRSQVLMLDGKSSTENAPDWDEEIGGLADQKAIVAEMFGVTQKYSFFFKG